MRIKIEPEDGCVVLVEGDLHDVRMAVVVVERVARDLLVRAEVKEGQMLVLVAAYEAVVAGAVHFERLIRLQHGPAALSPREGIEKVGIEVCRQHAHAVACARRRSGEGDIHFAVVFEDGGAFVDPEAAVAFPVVVWRR